MMSAFPDDEPAMTAVASEDETLALAPAEAEGAPPAPPPPSVSRMDRLAAAGEELIAWLKTLTSAAVYATLIVTFGFQIARVDGQSMQPTLESQDRLVVNKLVYQFASPAVGDIVMLQYPLDPSKSYVKRVVAGPGDSIRSIDGRVYLNGTLLPDAFIPSDDRSDDTWGPEVVPPAHYFVMGDHRNNSSDSRTWGDVPKNYILGKVQVRWWPLTRARVFSGF